MSYADDDDHGMGAVDGEDDGVDGGGKVALIVMSVLIGAALVTGLSYYSYIMKRNKGKKVER